MRQKALFLDRDGIINIDYGYVSQKEEFVFVEGIFELLHLFVQQGYLLFIITNQSGIARGYYSLEEFETLTEWMLKALKEQQITIEKVAYCPHLPSDHCSCRKPQTGMIDEIVHAYPIDVEKSWLIGDKQSDIDVALHANIAHTIAIGTKKLQHCTYQFDTIVACKQYLQKHLKSLL